VSSRQVPHVNRAQKSALAAALPVCCWHRFTDPMLSEQLAASGTLTAGFFPIELIHSYYMQFFGICQGTRQKPDKSNR